MLEIVRQYGPIRIYQKWFYEKPDIQDRYSFTVYKQAASLVPYKGFIRKDFYTLHIHLDKHNDEIFSSFYKTIQQEIKKSLKENTYTTVSHDIRTFLVFFNPFAQFKGIPSLSHKTLSSYGDAILFTWIYQDTIPLAAHAYLIDNENSIVRLLYSATSPRNEKDKNFVARSNKRLHWHDICYFKEQGFKIYDFGGLALKPGNKETEGIDFFKQSFGGEIVHQSHYESIPAFVLKKLLRKD
jgi:lipid II:glycine glycyltransferase (peptidoglycan interpeptide bridge formation enzyme)